MSWAFALINGRLGEIYFDTKGNAFKPHAHCYVKRSEFTTKKERRDIDADIKRNVFSYRKGVYRDKISGRQYRTRPLSRT